MRHLGNTVGAEISIGAGEGLDRPKRQAKQVSLAQISPKTGLIFLRLAENRLYSRPSHTETWLRRPSGGNRADKARLLTRFRRNQPEN